LHGIERPQTVPIQASISLCRFLSCGIEPRASAAIDIVAGESGLSGVLVCFGHLVVSFSHFMSIAWGYERLPIFPRSLNHPTDKRITIEQIAHERPSQGGNMSLPLTPARTLKEALDGLPRVSLAYLPTPLERLDNLSKLLDVDLWVKRDDQTGLALGGNKARKLEFLLGEAIEEGADVIITTGGSQSNHARMTAAACRKVRLECRLVLDRGVHPENGNLLLDQLLGPEIEIVESSDPAIAAGRMEELASELRNKGRRPYVIPRGGSVPAGAVGYANMVAELSTQCQDVGIDVDAVYLGTGSCGTHSGIMAGRVALGLQWTVQGISVSRSRREQIPKIVTMIGAALSHLKIAEGFEQEDVRVDESFVGPGYGHPTAETWGAIELLGVHEGLILDPVYTGKAMAGLLTHIRSGRVKQGQTVVFVHTGGSPALFAYYRELEEALTDKAVH
jgi:D-cysteine desulfhydrase family pyridoxal phosphate-dependent enzyme